ncbi:MAG: FAD-dependent oxidoreductase [Albidovulum sp.]|uniref:FAD-dependent oxidoreductase n=1 Tax=Albidovulum sp. TaxID=1872424 RepID=UPI003C88F0C3
MSLRVPLRVTVIGASGAGCDIALKAQAAGHHVTLVDEHPQTMGQMSFDAPWFYGAALPAALTNANAIAQVVLEANPQIVACFEEGIDVRVGTIAWGAFQDGPNSRHVGHPRVGLVGADGNDLLEHDVLILATGVRDFVPSFRGAELPGVFGVKAGMAFLDLYQCYEGERTVVLGTSQRAVDFVKRALARGVGIVGMIEPGVDFVAGHTAHDEVAALGVPVHFDTVLLAAEGKVAVTGARLCALTGRTETLLDCDSLCLAIGTLPNIELPAAMGCRMRFDSGLGYWLPETDATGRTSLEKVFWLSGFATGGRDAEAVLAAMDEGGPMGTAQPAPEALVDQGTYLRRWIEALYITGGGAVTLCKCESVSRDAFLGLAPPAYLQAGLRQPKSPVSGPGGAATYVHQDFLKRMTRVGMGHCQGKRCRDEAALLLSLHFGMGMESIRPGSYRFPVRPVDLALLAADDDTYDTREKWSYWLHAPETAID